MQSDKTVVMCDQKLERLAMMPDMVANVVMEVSEYEQESVSAGAGVSPSAGGTAASGGMTCVRSISLCAASEL